ncbi:hypothetical protein M8J76_003070 [Diaphorina citri]|nr:hypothetical protein M8J76_003070 [Diaphorina citri]
MQIVELRLTEAYRENTLDQYKGLKSHVNQFNGVLENLFTDGIKVYLTKQLKTLDSLVDFFCHTTLALIQDYSVAMLDSLTQNLDILLVNTITGELQRNYVLTLGKKYRIRQRRTSERESGVSFKYRLSAESYESCAMWCRSSTESDEESRMDNARKTCVEYFGEESKVKALKRAKKGVVTENRFKPIEKRVQRGLLRSKYTCRREMVRKFEVPIYAGAKLRKNPKKRGKVIRKRKVEMYGSNGMVKKNRRNTKDGKYGSEINKNQMGDGKNVRYDENVMMKSNINKTYVNADDAQDDKRPRGEIVNVDYKNETRVDRILGHDGKNVMTDRTHDKNVMVDRNINRTHTNAATFDETHYEIVRSAKFNDKILKIVRSNLTIEPHANATTFVKRHGENIKAEYKLETRFDRTDISDDNKVMESQKRDRNTNVRFDGNTVEFGEDKVRFDSLDSKHVRAHDEIEDMEKGGKEHSIKDLKANKTEQKSNDAALTETKIGIMIENENRELEKSMEGKAIEIPNHQQDEVSNMEIQRYRKSMQNPEQGRAMEISNHKEDKEDEDFPMAEKGCRSVFEIKKHGISMQNQEQGRVIENIEIPNHKQEKKVDFPMAENSEKACSEQNLLNQAEEAFESGLQLVVQHLRSHLENQFQAYFSTQNEVLQNTLSQLDDLFMEVFRRTD